MSVENNKHTLRRAYEMMSTGSLDELDQVVDANYVMHNPPHPSFQGREGLKLFFGMLRQSFSDFRIEVDDMIAEGDKVVARIRMTGRHTGEYMGIAATSKQVTQEVIDIIRYADGKAVERWGQSDTMNLLQQLGAIPSQN